VKKRCPSLLSSFLQLNEDGVVGDGTYVFFLLPGGDFTGEDETFLSFPPFFEDGR